MLLKTAAAPMPLPVALCAASASSQTQPSTDPATALDDVIVTGARTFDFGARSGILQAQAPQSIQVLDGGGR